MTETATPFHDLDAYVALPRVGTLAMSPDGRRVVVSVQTLDRERTGFRSALWEVDPTGESPARRLTRSAKGESTPVFTAAGDLLFTSARPDPDGKADKSDMDDPTSALWLLPANGGEARVIATAAGGIAGPLTARDADMVCVAAPLLPSAVDLSEDATLRKARKELKVSAILHASYPLRHWDHDIGPDDVRRFVGSLARLVDDPDQPLPKPDNGDGEVDPRLLPLRPLTGAGRQLFEHSADLSPDGTTLATSWSVAHPGAARRNTLVAIDTATAVRRVLVDDPDAEAEGPAISPDGAWVAFIRGTITTPTKAPMNRLGLVSLAEEPEPVTIADDWDRWPISVAWLPDGSGLVVTADDTGRRPIFLVTFTGGTPGADVVVERVTADDAVFTGVAVAPDGAALYALRSSPAAPAAPVRIDLAAFLAGGTPGARPTVAATPLRGPVPAPALPGTLHEVEANAPAGHGVRSWLAVPYSASAENPAPLLLWIHGGPLSSWNDWSWRWNPWLAVARGYAVLLPDPTLSTGYGQDAVQRGWGRWGAEPYTDLMAATDAAVARDDIDETRTAAMGGSFGGYMANWVAGHTDRFRAIVTHASLWALDQFGPTTDHAYYWMREMTTEMAREFSPRRSVGNIRTPILVIHGDRDYRVPVGEALRLWYELLTDSSLPAAVDGSTVHRFLYFPDENHWVTSPQHAKVWYQTAFAFLATHVLGQPEDPPSTLG